MIIKIKITEHLAQKSKDTQTDDQFGIDAKISNEYAIIGTLLGETAYIYERASDGT